MPTFELNTSRLRAAELKRVAEGFRRRYVGPKGFELALLRMQAEVDAKHFSRVLCRVFELAGANATVILRAPPRDNRWKTTAKKTTAKKKAARRKTAKKQ